MRNKSILEIVSERIVILENRLKHATDDKERAIFVELLEQAQADYRFAKSKVLRRKIFSIIGAILLGAVIIESTIIVFEYAKIQSMTQSAVSTDSIGNVLQQNDTDENQLQ